MVGRKKSTVSGMVKFSQQFVFFLLVGVLQCTVVVY